MYGTRNGLERVVQIQSGIQQFQIQLDKFSGDKSDPMYHTFKSILARNATEIEKLRAATKNKKKQTIYDSALATIKDTETKLQEKLQSIEGDPTNKTNSFAPAKNTIDEPPIQINTKLSGHAQLSAIWKKLEAITKRTKNFQGLYNDVSYSSIVADLFKIREDLNALEDEGQPNIYYSLKKQYTDYIGELFSYFETKVTSALVAQEFQLPTNTNEINLEELQEFVDALGVDINNGLNDATVVVFRNRLVALMAHLDGIHTGEDFIREQIKPYLMQEMNELSDQLDAFANNKQQLNETKEAVETFKLLVDAHQGAKNGEAWIMLNEEILNCRLILVQLRISDANLKMLRKELMCELMALNVLMDAHPEETMNLESNS